MTPTTSRRRSSHSSRSTSSTSYPCRPRRPGTCDVPSDHDRHQERVSSARIALVRTNTCSPSTRNRHRLPSVTSLAPGTYSPSSRYRHRPSLSRTYPSGTSTPSAATSLRYSPSPHLAAPRCTLTPSELVFCVVVGPLLAPSVFLEPFLHVVRTWYARCAPMVRVRTRSCVAHACCVGALAVQHVACCACASLTSSDAVSVVEWEALPSATAVTLWLWHSSAASFVHDALSNTPERRATWDVLAHAASSSHTAAATYASCSSRREAPVSAASAVCALTSSVHWASRAALATCAASRIFAYVLQ